MTTIISAHVRVVAAILIVLDVQALIGASRKDLRSTHRIRGTIIIGARRKKIVVATHRDVDTTRDGAARLAFDSANSARKFLTRADIHFG